MSNTRGMEIARQPGSRDRLNEHGDEPLPRRNDAAHRFGARPAHWTAIVALGFASWYSVVMQGRGGSSGRILCLASVASVWLACGKSQGDDGRRGPGTGGDEGGSGSAGMSGRGGKAGGVGEGGSSGGGAGGDDGGSGGRPTTITETCAAREDETRWNLGQILYVDDDIDCAGHDPCFPSIANAILAASDGDTIVVLPGTHWGADISQDAELSSLRITSLDGPAVTIISEYCFQITGREHDPGQIWIDGFTFRDCGPTGSIVDQGWGVYVSTSYDADVRIQDNIFEGTFGRGGVGLWSSTVGTRFHAVVARNRFTDHHGEESALDIDLPADSDEDYCIRVENNVITGSASAINIFYTRFSDGAGKFEVANNTLYGNDLAVPLSGPAGPYLFVNNVIFGNTQDFGTYEESNAPLDIRSNLIGGGQFTGLNGNFAADPLFEDAAAGDFRLRGASPAADRGETRHTALEDITGTPRTDPPDLGAYERTERAGERLEGLRCGDGIVQRGRTQTAQGTFLGFETCDDGNSQSGDGCSSLCQFEPAPARGQIAMALEGTHLCVLRGNGSIACWGEAGEIPPSGSYRELALSAYHGCALRDDGTVSCWLPGFPTQTPFTPTGTFTQLDGDYYDTCGLRMDGSITCWDESAITLEQPGPYARVDTYQRVCGLSTAGVATCFPAYANFPTGPFLELFPTTNTDGCGLLPSGQVVCVPEPGQVYDTTPRAGFARVAMDQTGRGCGVRPDGRAVRWDRSGVDILMQDEAFLEVVPGFTWCCGLTLDRRAWCTENSYGLPAE